MDLYKEVKMDLHDEIAKVAYELYEKSGRAAGRDTDNWLEAERIVKARYARKEKTAAGQTEEVGRHGYGHHSHHHH